MITNTTNAEHYTWGDGCDGWRLANRPGLSVIQERVPPGCGEIRHYHERARQLFFVIRGALEVELGGEIHPLLAGDALEIEPGIAHRVRNTGTADAEFLVVSAPSTVADRINIEQ